jgi:hypothetical protein
VSESDVGNTYCFCIGSSALAISANFTPLLRRVVFVGEAVRGERRSELYRTARIDMRNAAGAREWATCSFNSPAPALCRCL